MLSAKKIEDWYVIKLVNGWVVEIYTSKISFPASTITRGVHRSQVQLILPIPLIDNVFYANASGNDSGCWYGVNFGTNVPPTPIKHIAVTKSGMAAMAAVASGATTAIVIGKYK